MEHYRRTAHTRFDIKSHFVWVTKYRKPVLAGAVGMRVRTLVRQICAEHEVEILKGHVIPIAKSNDLSPLERGSISQLYPSRSGLRGRWLDDLEVFSQQLS